MGRTWGLIGIKGSQKCSKTALAVKVWILEIIISGDNQFISNKLEHGLWCPVIFANFVIQGFGEV